MRLSQGLVSAQPVLMFVLLGVVFTGALALPERAFALEALYTLSIAVPLGLALAMLWRKAQHWRSADVGDQAGSVTPDTHALGFAVLVPTIVTWTGFAAIGSVVNTTEVAIYQACFLLTTPFNMICTAYIAAESPKYADLLARDDRTALWSLYRHNCRFLLSVSGIPLVLLIVFADPVLRLFSPEFASGVLAIRVFAIGMLITVAFCPVTMMLVMDAQDAAFLRITLGALLVWAIILVATLATLGVLGAAIAFAVQALLTQVSSLWVMKRRRPAAGPA